MTDEELEAYRTEIDRLRAQVAIAKDLAKYEAQAWSAGVDFALQMVNPRLINDTWNAHNPFRRETGGHNG